MEQVSKVKIMFKYILLVVTVVLFTGCMQKQNYIEKKVYKGYSKDAILEASKKVFFLADKNRSFYVDSYRNKVEITKRRFYHHIYDVGIYLDTWVIETVQEDGQTRVLLSLKRTNVDTKKEVAITKEINMTLFWNRMDYLLGKNKKWDSCFSKLSLFTNNNILCDKGFLLEQKPKASDMVKNPLILQRPVVLYSVDTIDADIYKFTDLTIKKNKEDILEPDTINNGNTLDPTLIDENNTTQNSNEDDNGEAELEKLKGEMNLILDNKSDIKVDEIIENQVIEENSEFILDSSSSESENKLDKLDKLDTK
jgi:hypothetical protein